MAANNVVRLNLHGVNRIEHSLRKELIFIIQKEFEPLVREAGKSLVLVTNSSLGNLNLYFDNSKPTAAICRGTVLGEDAEGSVWVKAHGNLRICNAPDPLTGKRDTRRFLTTKSLLAWAVANTAIHELGHFIANLDHSSDLTNYMITGSPPVNVRNMETQREFFAGHKTWTPTQRQLLVECLRTGNYLGDLLVNGK